MYCVIRKTWVAATPEEYVRQKTLEHLVQHLGFPSSYIAVEKELKSMMNLSSITTPLPDRRIDIICYAKEPQGELRPLIIIECKAVPISSKDLRQVIGYNHLLKASFIALINQTEQKLGWFDTQIAGYKFVNYFPTYSELINSIPR